MCGCEVSVEDRGCLGDCGTGVCTDGRGCQIVKDEFYTKPQDTVGRVAQSDTLIVMRGLNARVGDETDIWGEVLGRHGKEICNENWKGLLQFSSEHFSSPTTAASAPS